MLPRFEELNNAERESISSSIDSARELASSYSPADVSRPLDAEVLDRTFAAWLAAGEKDATRINHVLNSIGCAFGQLLVEAAGFEWVIASDEYGTDLALLALPGRGDVLVYPTNMIAKRWESKETEFLVPLFKFLTHKVRELAAKGP